MQVMHAFSRENSVNLAVKLHPCNGYEPKCETDEKRWGEETSVGL